MYRSCRIRDRVEGHSEPSLPAGVGCNPGQSRVDPASAGIPPLTMKYNGILTRSHGTRISVTVWVTLGVHKLHYWQKR